MITKFRSSFVLRSLLLILLVPWLLFYLFNLFWGGFGFSMILFNPGTETTDFHSYGTDDLGGQFPADESLAASSPQPWYVAKTPVLLFFIGYFAYLGLLIRAYTPTGIPWIDRTFYRSDQAYRCPPWVRRTYGAVAMVFFPALFLFCPLLGPFFWLWVPFLNDGFPLPGTVSYFLVLTLLLIAPFWIYRRPQNGLSEPEPAAAETAGTWPGVESTTPSNPERKPQG